MKTENATFDVFFFGLDLFQPLLVSLVLLLPKYIEQQNGVAA